MVGVQVLLDAARAHHVARFLQVSTDEVYGDLPGETRASEGSHLQPSSPYAASKAAADLMCLAYRRTHGVPLVIVRSSNNYGPWQFPEKFIPLVIRNALAGKVLPIYGDGKQQRDWLFVEDNCDAILRVLERGEVGSVYNVATSEERTNLETVSIVCGLLADEGLSSRRALESSARFVQDRPGHDRRYAMDASKIRRELGWSPRLRYEVGLRRTVRWYLDHKEWLTRAGCGEYTDYHAAVYSRR
jgi:dTDP-glucose 4,6-dehydratase